MLGALVDRIHTRLRATLIRLGDGRPHRLHPPALPTDQRSVQPRWGNVVTLVVETDSAFDPDEQARLMGMCDAMGVDWADLDVLRDRSSGRLYVVDVNPTRGPPHPSHVGPELVTYWRLQERGFAALLRAHTRGAQP